MICEKNPFKMVTQTTFAFSSSQYVGQINLSPFESLELTVLIWQKTLFCETMHRRERGLLAGSSYLSLIWQGQRLS